MHNETRGGDNKSLITKITKKVCKESLHVHVLRPVVEMVRDLQKQTDTDCDGGGGGGGSS